MATAKIAEGSPRKRLRLQGHENLPLVDILLPCCGEPVDVIMETVRAACALDYPTSRFRVLVLDDGGSIHLEQAVTRLRSQYPHLSYHSRGRQSGQVFAKSGNLNFALTTLQQKVEPEFCAVLDADSIPTPDFLRATLPHLLKDQGAALVSTRQHFSNLPEGDPLSQSRIHFYTCVNADLDILGRAIDAGSGAVFRRKAVVDVGLYPTFSFSEDWQLSQMLHGMGYRTLQVQEPLQFGLVPTSLSGHIAQRKRWNIGHAQQVPVMFSREHAGLPQSLRGSITFDGIVIVLGELSCFLGFLLIPLLIIGGQVVPSTLPSMVTLQFVLALLHLLSTWTYECLQAASTGFQSQPFAHMENKWLAGGKLTACSYCIIFVTDRHCVHIGNIWAILRFYLFSSKPTGSFVTGSLENSWNRFSVVSFSTRLYRDLWGNGVLYNVCWLIATAGALAYSIAMSIYSEDPHVVSTSLTAVAWPPLLHVCYLAVVNNWVPVAYLLRPPRYPDRSSPSNDEEQDIAVKQSF